jgi:plastocyanin
MSVLNSRVFLVAVLLAALGASACSTSPSAQGPKPVSSSSVSAVPSHPPTPNGVQVVTVTVESSGFQPKDATAAPGANVIWIQNDTAPHIVMSGTPGHGDGRFSSPSLSKNASFTVVLATPGVYRYFDQLHPSLTGQLVVPTGSSSPKAGSKAP